jgi:hypothetical protein
MYMGDPFGQYRFIRVLEKVIVFKTVKKFSAFIGSRYTLHRYWNIQMT